MRSPRLPVSLCIFFFFFSSLARAERPEAEPPTPPPDRAFDLHGYLRVRTDLFQNLDLNVGPTPSGQTYFPTAIGDPRDKTLTAADMRLRLEPRLDLGLWVRLRSRIDVLDNLALGSTPEALPQTSEVPLSGASTSQQPPADSVRVKRVWGEVTLPIGTLAAGRMGAVVSWGTGMFLNNGDCLDCDFGDAGDRLLFETHLADHKWILAYDLAAVGPGTSRFGQVIDLERSDDVRTIAFAVAHADGTEGIARRLHGGRTVFDYGLLGTYRFQNRDAPGWYRGAPQGPFDERAFVSRELRVGTIDAWALLISGNVRAEAELVTLFGRTGDPSLVPGIAYRQPITQAQVGGVFRGDYAARRVTAGAELGFASGDPAPGFGVRPGQALPMRGDLDGPQFAPPGDTTADNFLFNRDYRIDLILWRRLIGRITDALYVRPRAEWRATRRLTFDGALIYSRALEAQSTPGGEAPLGVELDLGARYVYDAAFEARLGYGVLFPLSGLRSNGRDPSAAQTIHLLLAFLL